MKNTLTLLMLLTSAPAIAETEIYGSISIEGRGFLEGSPHSNQSNGSGFSVVFEPEIHHEFDSGNDSVTFAPFFRIDKQDSDREHADIRELYWLHSGDEWEVKVGLDKIFWGVIESNHLVDIINQTDTVENPDGEDKLGQPMLSLGFDKDWGNLVFYALPYFRERSFVGEEGRLRGPFTVNTDNPVYESSLEERHVDVAVRFEKVIGDWDIGVSHFSGTSREPVLKLGVDAAGKNVFVPHYGLIDQTGIDVQYTTDAWLWKFESMTRSGQGKRFFAFAGGVEYTFFDLNSTGTDIGLLAEYSRDDRGTDAPGTLLDNDVFAGVRYALNDIDDTQFLAGGLIDVNSKFRSYSIEASKRFGDDWRAELEGRFNAGAGTGVDVGLETEDFVLLSISRYY